jgi:hypothetical protein
MIDHRLLKPAGAVILAGAAVAALTVGQSAFAVGGAAATSHAARAACTASGPWLHAAPVPPAGRPTACHPEPPRGEPGPGPRPRRYLMSVR